MQDRRKWLPMFDDATAIVFVASLNAYRYILYDDEYTSLMHESLSLFEQVVCCKQLTNVPKMLLLNKKDLFDKSATRIDMVKCFSNYTGGLDASRALEFIKASYQERVPAKHNQVYMFVCEATDMKNVGFVFESIKDSIMHLAMGSSNRYDLL